MGRETLVEKFRRARTDPALAVLEGFHPLKHAVRFDAELADVVCADSDGLSALADRHAPDIADAIRGALRVVPQDVFQGLSPVPPPTGVIAVARRPRVSLADILSSPSPVVVLQHPRNLLNIGAAVRVAAAAGAAGVITTGPQDPWHPAALIASTGLHYAIPVARCAAPPQGRRPLVAVDPGGRPLRPGSIPANSTLVFGSERAGVGLDVMASADLCVSIPMRPGVSSLNLATAIAVVLYTGKLHD